MQNIHIKAIYIIANNVNTMAPSIFHGASGGAGGGKSQVFRKYNLVEYKPPGDYLSIDDYFYMQGNASLLKAGGHQADVLLPDDISVTCVCYGYPRKLIRFLREERHLEIAERFPGIYYVKGEVFSTQIVVTRLLDPADNLWLSSFVATINIEVFRRREDMCRGLMEVVRPEIEAEKIKAIEEVRPLIVEEVRPQIMEEAKPAILLETARELLDCLDVDTIAQKLGLPVEMVRRLDSR